ncbi:uncharacterized protein METZ01_LOCUS337999 [marine metagenome]|uniref:Uncharacterized protein n=1 Tax=marine metagenome TaxID=408172 RepID=A0A382QJT0_9ZZZZ
MDNRGHGDSPSSRVEAQNDLTATVSSIEQTVLNG